MDYKKIGAAGALLTLLLSGCGTQAQTQDTAKQAAATATAQSAGAQDAAKQDSTQQTKQDKPQMNEKQREMMLTFQSLITMDKADGLAITKEQAAPMLTVVQDSITKGELTSDAQTKLTEKLTAEQKKYLEDSAAKMKERMNNMKQGGGQRQGQGQGQTQGQAQAQGDSAASPKASTDANSSATGGQQAQGGQNQAGSADRNNPQGGKSGQDRGVRGGNGGKNAGQQLVELLQSKTK